MKNLKRALCLALSSVMLMGMMVIGSGASYEDVKAEHNVEAIEVLEAIEVMSGKGDGFDPDGLLTRQEMAVIMCNLLDYTVGSYKGTTKFNDVDSWALPYVEACYTNGIISGYSETKFGGNDSVTTGQAALMLMKALGYFQEVGDFGQDWLVSATKQGALIHLFDGIDTGAREALTRNDVAQMVLNALKSDLVYVASHDIVSDGKGGFMTKANYGSRTATAAAKYNAIINDTVSGRAVMQLGEELFDGKLKMTDTVATKDDYCRPATEWALGLKTIGTYADTPAAVYTAGVSKTTVYADLGAAVYNAEKNDLDATVEVYTNGNTTPASVAIDNIMHKKNSSDIATTGNGTVTEFYVDNAGQVTMIQINTYLVAAAADYNAVKEEVKIDVTVSDKLAADGIVIANATLSSDDFDGLENVKQGDYLLVNVWHNGTNYDIYDVAFAETVQGKVDGYVKNYAEATGTNVTLDGTTYKYAHKAGTDKNTDYTVGEPAALVLDQFGYVIGIAEALVNNDFLFVTAHKSNSGLSTTDAVAEAFFTDGTAKTINVAKYNGNVVTTSDFATPGRGTGMAGWYRYVVNANGQYVLTGIDTAPTDVLPNHDADSATKNGSGVLIADGTIVPFNASVVADNDSILIVVDKDGNVETFTGAANMPKITMTTGNPTVYIVKNDNSYVEFAFVDLRTTTYTMINSAADPEFIFVLDKQNAYYGADGDKWFTYKALKEDGTVEVITVSENTATTNIGNEISTDEYDLIYNASYDKNGRITAVNAVNNNAPYFNYYLAGNDATVKYSNGSLVITDPGQDLDPNTAANAKQWIVGDAKIVLITAKDSKMNVNKDAKYVINEVSASYLNAVLGGTTVFSGRIAGKTVDANSNVLDTLYIYVSNSNYPA